MISRPYLQHGGLLGLERHKLRVDPNQVTLTLHSTPERVVCTLAQHHNLDKYTIRIIHICKCDLCDPACIEWTD